jgi:deoxyribonuclease V
VNDRWPQSGDALFELQLVLGRAATEALESVPWTARADPLIAGGFVAFGRPEENGEPAWAAAMAWRPSSVLRAGGEPLRRTERALRGSTGSPRQARDVEAQVVVGGRVSAQYEPGLLALRQGPLLEDAVRRLPLVPDVVLVDATGRDHPRRAGLAVHLGEVLGLPTVGVTNRPLLARGELSGAERGARSPVVLQDEVVGYWVTTRQGARPVLAHAGWRTSPETAAEIVLLASTNGARTPIPIQEARRAAREARAETVAW